MKKTITAVALFATLIASPAFARVAHHDVDPTAAFNQVYQDPDSVSVDGQVVGRDPDANVRQELRRDAPELLEGSSGG